MIELYHKIAIAINKASYWVWLGLILSVAFCAYVIFSNSDFIHPDNELLVFVVPLWFLAMLTLKSYFIEISPRPDKDAGLFKRLWIRLKRLFSWIIALVFSLASIAIAYLTYKALMFLL